MVAPNTSNSEVLLQLYYQDPDGLEVEILAPVTAGKGKPEEALDADSFIQRFG